jgi:Zn-dependent peptidase ImmA (M78 family)
MQNELFGFRQMPPVNGQRIRQARELAGLTQAALAEILGVDQTMVAHIERGTRQPTDELLEAIAPELHFPASFFSQPTPPEFPRGSLLFRSKAVIGRKVIGQAHAHAELVFELTMKLASQASLIPIRLPTERDPIKAAQQVRSLFGNREEPATGLIRAIEKLGVIVIPIPELRECDAFAVWAGADRSYPVIGMLVGRSHDRTRMSLAHELGHLILHRYAAGATQQLETEAYQFAAELLTPASSTAVDLRAEKLNLFRLVSLKGKWQVSMQAMARRARDLGVITDRQYRYLMQQISLKGWRTVEPQFGPVELERPRAIRKLIEVTFGQRLNTPAIAKEFKLSDAFVANLLEMCSPGPGKQVKSKTRDRKKVLTFSGKK